MPTADRILLDTIVATAQTLRVPLVTKDRLIHAYASDRAELNVLC